MKSNIILVLIMIIISPVLMALDFSENWESGNFVSNGWSFENESGNWELWEYFGNPGASARFSGFPSLVNYDHRLVSPILDGTNCETVIIDFDFFGRVMLPQTDAFSLEVRIMGEGWQEVAIFNANTPGDEFTWLAQSFNISSLTAGNDFQIAFRAYGLDTMNIIRWHVDNIHIYEPQPTLLPFIETWSSGGFSDNNWSFEPSQGSWMITEYNFNNVAEFVFDMWLDYSYSLTSQPFSALDCSSVELSYDIVLDNFELTGMENLSVELSSGEDWQPLVTYVNDTQGFSLSETYDISDYVLGSTFRIRFRAHGADAFQINSWMIDNVVITDGMMLPEPRLYGHVLDIETMMPLTEAVVYMNERIQITCSETGLPGGYGFDFEALNEGMNVLSCACEGYSSFSTSVQLELGEELEYVIYLQPNPQNQVPEGLNAQIAGLDEVHLSWYPVLMEEYLVAAYDDGGAEVMLSYEAEENQLLANRFVFDTDIELQGACFYIELGNTEPVNDNPEVRFYITGESVNQPDLSDTFCAPVRLDNLIHDNPVPAFWLQIPVDLIIPAETPFYLCMEWEQEDIASDYIFLGGDLNEPAGNSMISVNGGSSWIYLEGEAALNAMIRCQYLPISNIDQMLMGYNIFRNNVIINQEPVTQTSYLDSGLTAGEYSYQVSAVYNDTESGISQPVTINLGELPAPGFVNASLYLWEEPLVQIYWNFEAIPGLEHLGFNIYRNDILLNTELLPVLPRNYQDYDILNGQDHSYRVTAVYTEGESGSSPISNVIVLMPPQSFYGIPWEEYVELGWQSPPEPVAGIELMGYHVYNFGELISSELITETFYYDADFMEQNEYFVTAQYSNGESGLLISVSVNGGEEVILTPQYVSACVDNSDVELFWERPDDGSTWHHWDDDGRGDSFGMQDNASFTAIVEFDEWDLLEYNNCTAGEIAFYPTGEGDYTILVWSNGINPGEYELYQEIPINDYFLDDWNVIPINDIFIMQTYTRLRIGVLCSNYTESALACDMGPNENPKADYVLIDGEWHNLSTDFNLDANWKIRVLMVEDNSSGPVRERDTNYTLKYYRLYRNDELLTELNHAWDYLIDSQLLPGEYSYALSCVYNVMDAVLVESERCDEVSIIIEENSFPVPENLSAETIDYNTVELSWQETGTQNVYTPDDTLHHLRGDFQLNLMDNRQLLGYYIFRDGVQITDEPVTEVFWQDTELAEGGYQYQAAAVYEEGVSELTPVCSIDIILPAPVELYAEFAENAVIITWAMPQPDWQLDHFVLYRNYGVVDDNLVSCEYLDTDLSPGEYAYQVQAVFCGGYLSPRSEAFLLEITPADEYLLPRITYLMGNYPNPFNPVTSIKFALAQDEDVCLKIYNIKGALVKILLDERMKCGYHNITWAGDDDNGNKVASGIYLYQMRAGDYESLSKMSLLK
jgi:hypothetical protein